MTPTTPNNSETLRPIAIKATSLDVFLLFRASLARTISRRYIHISIDVYGFKYVGMRLGRNFGVDLKEKNICSVWSFNCSIHRLQTASIKA